MNDSSRHPADEVLSAWIDGDLPPAERASIDTHVAACGACSKVARELRAIVAAGAALEDSRPARDLWPEIDGRIDRSAPRRAVPWLALIGGLAAGVCLMLAIGALRPASSPGVELARGERFLLLLHESPDLLADASAEEIESVVERYRDWAAELRARGQLEAGEKLADAEGRWLKVEDGAPLVEPRTERGGLAGFFLIRARDWEQAIDISRTCPHLGPGGWIELRRVEDT